MEHERSHFLSHVRNLVVKLGTQLLSDAQGRLDAPFLAQIAGQVAALRQRRIQVTIVSSGAIGAGLRELNLPRRPRDLAVLQAVAAVGQRRLMDAWAAAFAPHKLPVAQLLLTREDIDSRARFLNVRNTVQQVHELGGVPIINENDTISTDELTRISFGDNDILAALVAHAMQTNLLVLLTVVDGVLDAQGRPVRLVQNLAEAGELVRKEKSALGTGGMNSKLEAAAMVTSAGEAMVVANGRDADVLLRILDGKEVGTLFAPRARRSSGRQRWINAARPAGAIHIDEGAVRALVERGRSLLPAGVVKVEGTFRKGDLVEVKGPDGQTIARGLSNYPASRVEEIRGRKSSEVRAALGDAAYEEVIHRNNLVLCG